MSTLARDARIGTFGTKGLILFVLGLFLLVALFFIPEVIDFQEVFTDKQSDEQSLENLESAPIVEEQPIAREMTSETVRNEVIESTEQPAEVKSQSVSMANAAQIPTEITPNITWENLRAGESGKSLSRAYDEVLGLAKRMAASRPNAQNALFRLASGIKFVQEGADRAMSAVEAYRYLEDLSAAVTAAMQTDQVDRADLLAWNNVSLGPLFEQSSVMQGRTRAIQPFNPKLTLSGIEIYHNYTTRYGDVPPQAFTTFTVSGRDIAKIEMYHDRTLMRVLRLGEPDSTGKQSLYIGAEDARGVYTFVAYSINGDMYEKSYSFYPRARVYPLKEGRYVIPNRDPDSLAQLDSYFGRRGSYLSPSSHKKRGFLGGNIIGKF